MFSGVASGELSNTHPVTSSPLLAKIAKLDGLNTEEHDTSKPFTLNWAAAGISWPDTDTIFISDSPNPSARMIASTISDYFRGVKLGRF